LFSFEERLASSEVDTIKTNKESSDNLVIANNAPPINISVMQSSKTRSAFYSDSDSDRVVSISKETV
jgi:hypothetical protein